MNIKDTNSGRAGDRTLWFECLHLTKSTLKPNVQYDSIKGRAFRRCSHLEVTKGAETVPSKESSNKAPPPKQSASPPWTPNLLATRTCQPPDTWEIDSTNFLNCSHILMCFLIYPAANFKICWRVGILIVVWLEEGMLGCAIPERCESSKKW